MNDRTFRAADAHKLEDPARLTWLPPLEIARKLSLESGMIVADVGAGTGYFALPFAKDIAPDGRLFAIDLQPEMLELLSAKLTREGAPGNIELKTGTASATGLPDACCDLFFLANLWHELDDHAAVLREAARVLRPGGRAAILDWRKDMPSPPGPSVAHRIAEQDALTLLRAHHFEIQQWGAAGEYSYLIVATPDRNSAPRTVSPGYAALT